MSSSNSIYISLIFLTNFALFHAQNLEHCLQNWNYSSTNNRCYQIINKQSNWAESSEYCQNYIKDGHLASVNDLETESLLENLISARSDCKYVWIGGKWDFEMKNITWTDGRPYNFSNFAPGPGYFNLSNGLCVDMTHSNWHTFDCAKQQCFICMYPATNFSLLSDPHEPFHYITWLYVGLAIAMFLVISTLLGVYLYLHRAVKRRQIGPRLQKVVKILHITSKKSQKIDEKHKIYDSRTEITSITCRTNFSLDLNRHTSIVYSVNVGGCQIFDLKNHPNVNMICFPNDKEVYKFNIKNLEELGLLEATARHTVKKCFHKPSGKILAVKHLQIPQNRFSDANKQLRFKMLLREIENFRILWESPEIVDFYGFCLHDGQALICMELMDMSLKDFYTLVHFKFKERMDEKMVGYVAVKIVDALEFCKNKGVIHRDIKPSNVLVSYGGDIKLCDFGESRILENSLASTHVGTIAYWPPEHFTNILSKYDIRSDIWSLGITLMEIILGRLPYLENTRLEEADDEPFILHQQVLNMDFEKLIQERISKEYSEALCKFLKKCTKKFESRAKIEELKMTEFYEECKKSILKEEIAKIVSLYNISTYENV